MISQLSLRVLAEGLDDWVPLAAVRGIALQLGDVESGQASEASVASVRELAEHDLVEIGKVSDGGFFACDDPVDTIMDIIVNATRTSDLREWGFLYWLCNTPDGDRLARSCVTG
jgi:hypothetical protein